MERMSREEIAKGEFHCHHILAEIFSRRSGFQRIDIVETEGYGRGLLLDGRVQHVEADEYIYSEAMVHPPMSLLWPRGRSALCIGGGPGGIVRELLKHQTIERVVQVEIDAVMIAASRAHLGHISRGAWDDPRVELVVDEALSLLERRAERFDLIVNDASEPLPGSPARGLFCVEGLSLIRRHLTPPHGLFVSWAGSAGPTSIARASRIVRTLAAVFPSVTCYLSHPQAYGTSWLTAIGALEPLRPEVLEPGEIDAILARSVKGELRLYDGVTHRHMFALPKDVRLALQADCPPIDREHPLDFDVETER